MSAQFFFYFLNELRKIDKMRGLPSILSDLARSLMRKGRVHCVGHRGKDISL